uniref:Ig-like domain-containing protein n=1 Tax=Dromaius novaehollandiae TaxID=8790 RepID=A0A8C4JWT2_DRONO
SHLQSLVGFFAVCRALVAPREVSGRLGETLSLQCWYTRGYEGYNKYWCRGASRDSCRKVVETAGPDAPRQRGRVSITDNRVFCVILLTVERLAEEDAGSYWCGVERLGRDLMEPVRVVVLPGNAATRKALRRRPSSGASRACSSPATPGTTWWPRPRGSPGRTAAASPWPTSAPGAPSASPWGTCRGTTPAPTSAASGCRGGTSATPWR